METPLYLALLVPAADPDSISCRSIFIQTCRTYIEADKACRESFPDELPVLIYQLTEKLDRVTSPKNPISFMKKIEELQF